MNLLKPSVLQAMAFVLFLLALPLLSFGTLQDQQLLWYTGLAMVVVAGVLPPLARFVGPDETADATDDGTDDKADDAHDKAEDDNDDDKAERDNDDRSGRDDPREPSAGPVGPPGASLGREPRRARVEEQRELARREHDEEERS
ncbi:MAG TPA: hypothetical protein VMP67_03670 [Candidatus Limnocylindria bacterium]|nr:hypothetical protein [Candidatus Limnocylindria bacterium]